METTTKGAAKAQATAKSTTKTSTVNTPEVVHVEKVKLGSIGDRNLKTQKRSYRLAAPFMNDLLQKEIKTLGIYERASRNLTGANQTKAEYINAAAAQGQVSVELNIVKTIKGEKYYTDRGLRAIANGEEPSEDDVYVAGENIAELKNGDAIHRVDVVAIILTPKGKAICANEEQRDKMRNKVLNSNSAAAKQVIDDLFGTNISGTSRSVAAAPVDSNADEDINDEQVVAKGE